MRTKYLYESELFRCPRRSTDSPVWKSIMKTRDLLKSGVIWKVGKGDKISFWLDNQIENRSLLDITGIARSEITNIDIQVGEFITPQDDWDVNLLNTTLNYHPIIQKILGTTLSVFPRDDSFCWGINSSGKFSTKSATWMAHGVYPHTASKWPFYWIWKLT